MLTSLRRLPFKEDAPQIGDGGVGLAGGVVLNCKMNTRVMQADGIEIVFVQPVANDAGLALGAG